MTIKKAATAVLFLPVLSLLFWGCGPFGEGNHNQPATLKNTYPQNFVSPIAFFALEWGGLPHILASGFLVSKKSGYFMTARHFTDCFFDLGLKECRVFFGGRVYEASVLRVSPLQDAALLKITSPFNPDDFPDPLLPADRPPKKGEQVTIAGFHIHPFLIRETNKQENAGDILVPIIRNYYGLKTMDSTREFETVYETLEAKVLTTDKRVRIQPESEIDWKALEQLRYGAGYFIEVRTARNHKFSFAGLSGTSVVNKRGECVGIVTAGPLPRLEYDPSGNISSYDTPEEFKIVADILDLTPIQAVLDLLKFK